MRGLVGGRTVGAEGLPGGIDFGTGIVSKGGLVEEGAVVLDSVIFETDVMDERC
jgi:hypothetical protein